MTIQANPANSTTQAAPERKRIPMSAPTRKLEVPPIPGYHLYWFLESNVPRAIQGGYEFVQASEIPLNQHNVATDRSVSGNADLGGQVKVISGTSGREGAEYLVLMKIKQEWYDQDKQAMEAADSRILESIFRGETVSNGPIPGDTSNTYLKERPLFQRPKRKGTT